MADCAWEKLDDGVRGEAGGHAPWAHLASGLDNSMFAIKIDEIDSEPHPERMHSFARNDPETFSVGQLFAAEQPPAAIASITCELDPVREMGPAGEIRHPNSYCRRIGGALFQPGTDPSEIEAKKFHQSFALFVPPDCRQQ
jgi:hypothetical protein